MADDKPPASKDPRFIFITGPDSVSLREVARKLSGALGLFETNPTEWLLLRRDRQVIAKGLDRKKIEEMVAARDAARSAKNYAESDRLRAEAKTMGVDMMDSPAGTTWKIAA